MPTIIDLSDKGEWFTYDGGGEIKLRRLSSEDFKDIEKIFRNDNKKQNEFIWNFCILDWEKFFDSNGEKIPCELKYKIFLMTNNDKFFDFVSDRIGEIDVQ